MKRHVVVSVEIELDAENQKGIEQAAMEAVAALRCDFAMDNQEHGCFAGKIIAKGINVQDEEKLFEIVLETVGVSEKHFFGSRDWQAARARNLFGYYAKRYLEWEWSRIGDGVGRDKSTMIQGVQGLVALATLAMDHEAKNSYEKNRRKRALDLRWQMAKIQSKWGSIK